MSTLEIITAGKEEVSTFVKMVVSGLPGVGKTRFATTSPNPVWAAIKPGFYPLSEKNIPYVNITNENDLFNLKIAIEDGLVDYETLVVDSVDALQTRLFEQKLKTENRTVRKNDDWNWVENKMSAIFDALYALPINVIYITHTKDVGGFDGEDLVIKNNLQGGVANLIYDNIDYAVSISRAESLEDLDLTEEDPSTIVKSTIQTRPTLKNPLVFDSTNLLPEFIELNFEDDFNLFLEAKIEFSESTSTTVDLEPEVIEDAPEKKEVPGMPSQKEISAKFLKKQTTE